jgi:predicted RNA polymerase sigma factor
VAARRLTDRIRSDAARRHREELDAARHIEADLSAPERVAVDGRHLDRDDTLEVLFLCCHPALSAASQLALTLRAVGGLTTAEIARAFLVPEPTMAQRISRAKQRIRTEGSSFPAPGADLADRLVVVSHVLYLMFNEGYAASAGDRLQRTDLTSEAIRITRRLHGAVPADREVAGLLALMLLTEARRAARVDDDGWLVPLDRQDRTRWDRDLIAEGVALVTAALSAGPPGPYQVQAAIAAVHDEAAAAEDTDWPQVVALYEVLEQLDPSPVVALNRAVAVAEVEGPARALAIVEALESGGALAGHHRLAVVRGHLLARSGDVDGAIACYRTAAGSAPSLVERRHLELEVIRLRANRSG